MRFCSIDYKDFLLGFLCFCKETPGKKAALRDRACGPGPLRIPLGVFWHLRFEGANASPRVDFLERSPLAATSCGSGSTGWLLFLRFRHEVICGVLVLQNGFVTQSDRGDPVEMGSP